MSDPMPTAMQRAEAEQWCASIYTTNSRLAIVEVLALAIAQAEARGPAIGAAPSEGCMRTAAEIVALHGDAATDLSPLQDAIAAALAAERAAHAATEARRAVQHEAATRLRQANARLCALLDRLRERMIDRGGWAPERYEIETALRDCREPPAAERAPGDAPPAGEGHG